MPGLPASPTSIASPMTWSLWTAPRGTLSVRPLRDLTDAEAPVWSDWTPPGGLGRTGARGAEERLGWVDLPLTAASELPEYLRLREELLAEGFRRLVVVAMGGAALAPRALVSGLRQGAGLEVRFLDSLAPEAVREAVRPDRLPQAVFAVASKSGTTVETRSLEAVIFRALRDAGAVPGRQFLAVTDPGTPLHRWAGRAGYRRWFAGRVDVGGRFSALSAFGLLPAILAGYALEDELKAVRRVREALDGDRGADDPAFRLGALLARLRAGGRFRAYLSASAGHREMLPWLEQLFSESTGKRGTGILPVIAGPPRGPSCGDAFCIHLGPAAGGDRERLEAAARAGIPVVHCPSGAARLPCLFRLQIAVSVAAFRMGVDPYDQPDVEGTKVAARRLLEDSGAVPTPPAVSATAVERFLAQAARGGLVINAFGHRDRTAEARIEALRRRLEERLGAAPAVGFGSALLHSLGQIEKGGPEDLSVLMLTWKAPEDVPIPPGAGLPATANGIGVGAFARLQAAADHEELKRRGRPVLWLATGTPGDAGLAELVARLTPGEAA